MKLPYPIHPARTGRFCDKPAVKLGVIYLLASAGAVGAVAVALMKRFF